MSNALRAMMARAEEVGAMRFPISMYCGQVCLTGHVAPRRWWIEVTEREAGEERDLAVGRLTKKQLAAGGEEVITQQYEAAMASLREITVDLAIEADELILWDTWCQPIVTPAGTVPARVHLPVARVPLSSIDTWWVGSGTALTGRPVATFGFGVLIDV